VYLSSVRFSVLHTPVALAGLDDLLLADSQTQSKFRYRLVGQPLLLYFFLFVLVNQETRLLVTADKDFGELVFRQGRALPGVVLIRLAGLSASRKADIVASALAAHGQELPGAFTVVSPGAIRIRRRSSKPRSPSG